MALQLDKVYTAIYDSPVGYLLIKCTDASIQAILFTDDKQDSFDKHRLLQNCMLQLIEYFDGKRTFFELPIEQQGTPFQQKVWNLLKNIPYGKTLSYKELSHQYGDLKSIRAIASANGKNALSIIVPCHRVIGSNQSLTGYAGGLWRKKWLLEHEAKWYSGVQQLF